MNLYEILKPGDRIAVKLKGHKDIIWEVLSVGEFATVKLIERGWNPWYKEGFICERVRYILNDTLINKTI